MNRDEFFRLQGLVASAKNAIDELFREVVECVGVSTEENVAPVIQKKCSDCFWCTSTYGCTNSIAKNKVCSDSCFWFKSK